MLAVGAVASTGPPPAPQARRASHRLLARPQALPVAIQWPVVRLQRIVALAGEDSERTRALCAARTFAL